MDLSLALLRRGYHALAEERGRHDDADTFAARLLGRHALVLRGADGARVFYDTERVSRVGSVPPPLAGLIFGSGAMHGLDGREHDVRKHLFLDVLDDEAVERLVAVVAERLRDRLVESAGREVDLFALLVEVYGDSVLRWAGVPSHERQRSSLARQMAAIVDGFGGSPRAYARGWAARAHLDRWAGRLVAAQRRSGRTGDATPLARIASLPVPARTAGVELLNLLRPTVAVAWPATWAVVELLRDADLAAQVRGSAGELVRRRVAHEVRRVRPFVPALAGRARIAFTHDGLSVRPGDRLVLDVVGTDTDPAHWSAPDRFDPQRFTDAEPDAYAFVPQGGGCPRNGHRCPGEPLTVRIVEATLEEVGRYDLVSGDPELPDQPMTRMPRRPGPTGRLVLTAR
ncbi:cytochrome P450 [Nocardioides zeae]|uniref:Cytochrome P450 n=1 Tax=Nocardioides imazamoxiresistens TaxID=3231893 RepID=A0ABU3PQC9_9ACTN|nr:cytochrome P450 [Nocardioides zeae]MDT9591430.1 cytochrome P450 [Nocardioides zeae]